MRLQHLNIVSCSTPSPAATFVIKICGYQPDELYSFSWNHQQRAPYGMLLYDIHTIAQKIMAVRHNGRDGVSIT